MCDVFYRREQVDFDCSFLEQDNDFQKIIRIRKKLVAASRTGIAEMQMGDANDFESLTTLYRKIFRFLMEFSPTERPPVQDRAVEKEVAAALESVFPRIGLKAFVQLTFEEKNSQLMELARIVFGIRLFNRHQGRGGAGIDDVDVACPKLAQVAEREISKEVAAVADLCNKYQEVIVKAHLKIRRNGLRKRRREERALLEAKRLRELEDSEEEVAFEDKQQAAEREREGEGDNDEEERLAEEQEEEQLADWVLARWSFELANRRQYLAFLKSIEEEVQACAAKVADLCESLREELAGLGGLVGGRASVAKEMVYPRFDSLASTWITLWEEYNLLKVRNNTYVSLRKFRSSFSCSLSEQLYQDVGSLGELGADVSLAAGATGTYDDSFDDDALDEDFAAADEKSPEQQQVTELKGSERKEGRGENKEEWEQERDEQQSAPQRGKTKRRFSVELEDVSAQGAELLQAHNTPDFMLLPLELQGFCPWTMVHASGLLVPGKPALGVIRYDNMHYVCEHKTAIKAFMEQPEEHLRRIKEQARRCPEFIHLLRLQNYFPTASIARLIEKPEFDKGGPSHKTTRDAGTATPTHFVERRVDPNYHWNEWELRRRVLKVVNLQHCSTVGAQTDQSHFRRDGETQVYEDRVKGTQTRRDAGTNPAVRTTFVTGLRGTLAAEAKDVSRHIRPDDAKAGARNKARVVTLTLER